MLPQMGPPETTIWEYPFGDNSWQLELEDFLRAIELQRQPDGDIHDALAALEVVESVYQLSGFVKGRKEK